MADYETSKLYAKIYGCLVAGLVGDALGGPSEGMSLAQVQETFGEIKELLPYRGLPAGASTDDSIIKHFLCAAIVRKGGRIHVEDWARVFLEQPVHRLYSTPMVNSYYKMLVGGVPPREAGLGNRISNCSPMSIAPMGILNAGDPAQAAFDTYEVTQFIDRGPGPDAAAAAAAAVATAFLPAATPDAVVAAASAHLRPGSDLPSFIARALALAQEVGEYGEFRARFHASCLQPHIANDPRESVPVALALFWLAAGDPLTTIRWAASFGRDADTLAAIAGSIAGALQGPASLPPAWIALVTSQNPVDQRRLAADLCQVVVANLAAQEERVAVVRSLL